MLPQIVMLFLPGWIFVWVYRFISRRPYKKISFSIEIIVTSYVLSLIIPSLLSPIDKVLGSSLKSSPTALLFVTLMLGTFLGYLRRLPKAEKLSEAYQGSGLRSLYGRESRIQSEAATYRSFSIVKKLHIEVYFEGFSRMEAIPGLNYKHTPHGPSRNCHVPRKIMIALCTPIKTDRRIQLP